MVSEFSDTAFELLHKYVKRMRVHKLQKYQREFVIIMV